MRAGSLLLLKYDRVVCHCHCYFSVMYDASQLFLSHFIAECILKDITVIRFFGTALDTS